MPQNNAKHGRNSGEQRDRDDFQFEIVRHLGVLSTSSRGWIKELNLVQWNGRDPKYDIREWQPDHQKMSKGVTMTREEMGELYGILSGVSEEFSDDFDESEDSLEQIA